MMRLRVVMSMFSMLQTGPDLVRSASSLHCESINAQAVRMVPWRPGGLAVQMGLMLVIWPVLEDTRTSNGAPRLKAV